MKLSCYKKNITSLLLVLFLAMKITSLHAISHIDDADQEDTCAICKHAIAYNLTPTISPNSNDFKVENSSFLIPLVVTNNYHYDMVRTIVTRALFSRPPPFSL